MRRERAELKLGEQARVIRYDPSSDQGDLMDEAIVARARYMPLLVGRTMFVVSITNAHGLGYYLADDVKLVVGDDDDPWRKDKIRDRGDVYFVQPYEVERVAAGS